MCGGVREGSSIWWGDGGLLCVVTEGSSVWWGEGGLQCQCVVW